MSSPRTRVAIVSAHEVVTTGLTGMLGQFPDRVVVVPLGGGSGPAPAAAEPDVVLYDVLGLVDGDGSDLAELAFHTSSAVLAVARDLRPDLAARALTLGADGFFSIGVDAKELIAAVESANTGWHEGDPGDNPVVGSPDSDAGALRLGAEVGLTHREVDVLTMITQGFTNQEIADRFYLSINSVKTYIRGAYRRVGVSTRSQAVVWCLQHGFPAEPDAAIQD